MVLGILLRNKNIVVENANRGIKLFNIILLKSKFNYIFKTVYWTFNTIMDYKYYDSDYLL